MSMAGYMISLFAGYGYPGISNASLLCEYSSVFLNYKDMFKKYKDTKPGLLNQIMFLICYTAFRVILFPILIYRCLATTLMSFHLVGWFRKVCMISFIQGFLIMLLQFYWYRLICKGLYKIITG
jgi:hypothetical protein